MADQNSVLVNGILTKIQCTDPYSDDGYGTEGPVVKDSIQLFESKSENPKTHQPGSYPDKNATSKNKNMDKNTDSKPSKREQNQVTSNPASRQTAKANDPKEQEQLVKTVRKKFLVFVPNSQKNFISSVKIKSSCKELNDKKLSFHSSSLYEVSVSLPVPVEQITYWYEAKMSPFRLTSLLYEDVYKSHCFVISETNEQRDLWEGFEFESIYSHLLDIMFNQACYGDIKDSIMAIEKVCLFTFSIEICRNLIIQLVEEIAAATNRSKALFAVALGNILVNCNILYNLKCIEPRKASSILKGLRDFSIKDFPSSCKGYMASVCEALCRIVLQDRYCLLTTMEQCYPFLEEDILNEWVVIAIDQRLLIAEDRDDMLEPAASLCRALYRKLLSKQSSAGTQSSDAKQLLERLLRHLPFKLVLHIFSRLSQPKTQELSSVEADLQKVINQTIHNQIVIEITKTKRNKKLICIFELWKRVSIVQNLSDEIKGKFESEIVDLIKKTAFRTEDSSEAVKKICHEDGLFEAIPEKIALLQALAESPNTSLHRAFITVLDMPKFENTSANIDEDEIKKWLKRLIDTHLKHVNKGEEVLFLYSNFSELMKMKSVDRKPGIHQTLEDMMINQLSIIGVKNALRKLEHIDAKAEPFFIKHLQSLIGKKPGQKGIDMLLALCGTYGDIRINSRPTGTIVCSLLEVYCSLKEEQSEVDTFSAMVTDYKLWEKVFSAHGTQLEMVKSNRNYKRAIHCLQQMVLMFKQHSVKFSFVECLGKSKDDSKKLLCFGGCTRPEIDRWWREAENRFEEEKQKLADVFFVLKESRKRISTSCLPIECSFLPDYIEQLLKYTDQYKLDLATGKLTAKDLKCDKGIWKCMDDLPKTCQSLKSLVLSKVFWNMCLGQVCKVYLHEEEKPSCEDSTLDGLCNLFGEMTVGLQHNEDDVKASVARFVSILKDTGIRIYRDAWIEIQKNDDMEMTRIQAMFSRCFPDIVEEMDIAQRCLITSIDTRTKKTLERISQIDDIIHTVKAIKSSLDVFGINMANDKIIYEAVASFEKLQDSDIEKLTICDVRKALQTVFDIAEKLRPDTINILNSLGKGSSLLEFLQNIVDEDIRNLIDAVEDISEQHVRESTVSGLIEVKRFLYPLLKPDFERNAQDLFHIVEKQTIAHGEAASSLPAKIDECMANLHNLKSLYNNVANRGEQTKETIKSIVKKGTFHFTLEKDSSTCDFKASYKQAKKQKGFRSRVSLVDLRSRALLLVNTERKDSGKHIKSDDLEKFVGYIDLCLEIADLVYNLHTSGHVKYESFAKAEDPFGLIQLKGVLHEDLKNWQDSIQSSRMSHFLLNFVQGTQIHTLYKFLERDSEKEAVETLLKYIHPDMKISSLRDVYLREKENQTGWDDLHKLHCMGQSLHCSFEGLGLHQRIVTVEEEKAKRITDVVQNSKLLVAHLEESSPVKTIMALYANTTQRLPEANQVLFCTREITWGELQLFLGRCLGAHQFYENHTLFCMANVEMLPNEIQFKLVESLRHLKQEKDFLLAIVCRGSKNHPFIDELSDHVMTVRPSSDQTVQNIFLEECPNVRTFTSEIAGLGKTNTICQRAHAIQKGVVTLHISGAVNKRILVERLRDLKISKYHVLHLDIENVENHVELDTFLFELIILRHVTAGTVSVSLPTSHISIEIANTIKDSLRNSLQTAVLFRREHLIWNDYSDFIVSKEIQSPVQVVCHFLYCLEKADLDKKDLLFSGTNAVTPLSANTCRNLLKKYINTGSDLSFSILNIFLNVLADQLKKMSCSAFFRTSRISDMIGHKTVPTVRSTLATALIEVSQEFSSRSVNACRSTQVSTVTDESQESYMLLDLAETATKRLEGMIQWEESNHLIYVFHNQNIQTISPMYRDKSKVPDHIRKLFEGQMKKQMQDFKSMDQSQLQAMLQKIARTNPLPLSQNKLQVLASGYALTPDNLLKMVLIMLRITANIPVVVMGETGCGKTSLIRYLAAICEVPFNVMNIHAGVVEHAIVERVLRSNEDAMKDLDEAKWLFLDEINTCEHLGLISDIICHHRCLGKLLAPNLVVMGACNPYKLRSVTSISTAGLQGKVKTDELSRLVYRVMPLPEMLVDYVWDFGSLSEKDEEVYIKRMVEDVFPGDRKKHELLSDLLSVSQQFIRDKEKTSYSVSLRDVQRCKTLTEWFLSFLQKKSNISGRAQSMWQGDVIAIILSLAHCYHSRFSDKAVRRQYRSAMENTFRMHGMKVFEEKYIHDIIKQEQRDILDRMDLPPGTAKNTALQENVFVILVCILNRMPIFVVGKPGCSKSLAMQVIRSNLRGKDSNNKFFKTLPQLYCVSFQGSESSTSDGIIKVFEKAEKYQETNIEDAVLSVVILDEIGLAEISRFNPLKVLHNLLEPDGRSVPNVAVVGISNWSLDASKMNRAIHLSRPEMDVDELYDTGISISDSFVTTGNQTILDYSKPFATCHIQEELDGIAKSYFSYTKALRFRNFHGLRDYYSLVKFVARKLSEADRTFSQKERSIVIMQGLERNFGGLPVEKETLLSNFMIHLRSLAPVQIPVVDLITDNITDPMARHLMLITTGESVLGIVEDKLAEIDRDRKEVIFGSQFEEDLTDDYNYRILSRIILCMEEGLVLILKDLENIYGSLYDMLNQNYTVIGKKKNCRVALGPYSNPICHVADAFRCIVLVDESKIKYTDPPFLNRFEKHYLKFADIISETQKEVIQSLEAWIDGLSNIKGKHFTNSDTFPIYSEDMVASLILKLDKGNQASHLDADIFLAKCKAELLWIIRPEAVVRLVESVDEEMQNESDAIRDNFFGLPVHEGMKGLMKYQFEEDVNQVDQGLMTVVFTSSNLHTKVLHSVTERKTQVDKLGAFKSEKQLSLRMQQFWLESEDEVLFLQCNAVDDEKHIMLAKSVIERFRYQFHSKNSNANKHVYLVIHMDRSKGTSRVVSQINFLSDWKLVTLDCLECPQTPLPELCSATLHNTIMRKRPLSKYIEEQLFWTFTRLRYTSHGRDVKSITDLLEKMKQSSEFLEILDDRICTWITVNHPNIHDTEWQVKVACDSEVLHTSSSFVEALETQISGVINVPLSKTVYQMEVVNILESYFIQDAVSQQRRTAWEAMLENDDLFSIKDVPEVSRNIPEPYTCESKDLCLKMPFSSLLYENIETTRDEFLDSLTLLKGKCDLDEDDDLPEEVFSELLLKQESFVLQKIPDMTEYLYESWTDDYIDDFCNMVSYTTCSSLPKLKRIGYMKWAISKKTDLSCKDPSELFIRLHSTFWAHLSLFTAELQLFETCSELLLDEKDDLMQTLTRSLSTDMKVSEDECMQMVFENVETTSNGTSLKQSFTETIYQTDKHNQSEHELLASTRLFPVLYENVQNSGDNNPYIQPMTNHPTRHSAEDLVGINVDEGKRSYTEEKQNIESVDVDGVEKVSIYLEETPQVVETRGTTFERKYTGLAHEEMEDSCYVATNTSVQQMDRVFVGVPLERGETNMVTGEQPLQSETSEEVDHLSGIQTEDIHFEVEEQMRESAYVDIISIDEKRDRDTENREIDSQESLAVNSEYQKCEDYNLERAEGSFNEEEQMNVTVKGDVNERTVYNPAAMKYTGKEEDSTEEKQNESDIKLPVAHSKFLGGFTGLEIENFRYGDGAYTELQEDIPVQNSYFSTGATALFKSFNVNSIPDARTDKSPEDVLVDLICKKMLPTKSTLEHYKGLSMWQSKVNCVLTLAAQVSLEPQSIHTLRFCNDVAGGLIIPFSLDIDVLQTIGQLLQQGYDLDSETVFQALMNIIESAPPEASSVCQRILSSYFIRCLSLNQGTSSLSLLLLLVVESRLPDKSLSLMKSPLHLALRLEMDENANIFTELLHEDGMNQSKHFAVFGEDLQNTDMERIANSESDAKTESSFLSNLDQCLKQVFLRSNGIDSSFVVLLVDLMEEIYCESLDGELFLAENDSEHISLFLSCHKILKEAKVGLQYIAAAAYFKTFIQSFACVMEDDNIRPNTLAAVNAAFQDIEEDHVSSTLLRFFLKAIGINSVIGQVIKHCANFQEKLPFLEKITWTDSFIKESFDSCPLSIHVPDQVKVIKTLFWETQDVNKIKEQLALISNEASNTAKGIVLLYAVAMKQFYIPRSYMTLDDTRKTQANLFLEEVMAHSIQKPNMKLLKCLIGKDDFKVPEFMDGESSQSRNFLISSFLSSLYGLLLAFNTFSNGDKLPILAKCLLHPLEIQNCFLPGYPDNDMQTPSLLVDTLSLPEAKFTTCQCGHRIAVHDGKVTYCMICGQPLSPSAVVYYSECGNVEPKTGFVTCPEMNDVYFGVRGMSPVVCNIMYILTKGCLLGSLAVGLASANTLKEATSDLSDMDISQSLWEDIECHWENISRLLNLGDNSVGLLLHTTLRHTRDQLCDDRNAMKSVEKRMIWEKEFSCKVSQILKDRFQMMNQINSRHLEMCELPRNCIEQSVHELDDPSSLPPKERLALMPTLFRMRGLPTKENFMYELHEQKQKFPFLMLALRHCEELELPIHIFNIVQWHIAAASNANYMMKKHECENMTVTDFVYKSQDEKKKDIVRKRFDAFQKSWTALKDNTHIGNFDRINGSSKMSECLILGTDSVVYKVLQKIVAIQNNFLDKTLEMAPFCHAVNFISREPKVSVLPCVELSEVKKQHLLNFKWDDSLLQESQCDLSYGCGRHIFYDFSCIEKGLAVSILVGRSYIHIEKDALPRIIFTDELFKNYASLVRELKEEVKQEHLPSEVIAGVKAKKENDPRMATELLTHLGVIMTLLKKTKGDPEKTLVDYAEEWKILLTRKLPNELLPSPQSSVKLCHVVALHELLEELNSDAIIDALEDEFRVDLDLDLENHFKNITNDNVKLAELILKAIKRFTQRCLSLREADSEQPLHSYLSDESFWPDGVVVDGGIQVAGKMVKMVAILPDDLSVKHVHATVTFIEAEMEKKRQDDMKMSKVATNWQGRSKDSPLSKAVSKKKTLKKFRNH